MLTRVSRALLFTILGATGPTALGQGVNPATSPTNTNHPLTAQPSSDWLAGIGLFAPPVGVELDPNGPVWTCHIQPPSGADINSSNAIRFMANLAVAGDRPWTGWHVDLPSGFVWYDDELGIWPLQAIGLQANGSAVPVSYQLTNGGANVDATFPALAPGTQVSMVLNFHWSEPTPYTGSFDLHQAPVPEPVSLFGFAFLFLLYRGKR
jgi:hypothetical protein